MKSRRMYRMKNKIAMALLVFMSIIATSAIADGGGHYLKHHYSFTQQNGMVAATFEPFLPRNDSILIGAMLELVIKVYGKHQIVDLKPNIVNRNGQNLISFHGKGYEYFFLIMKQDTGEVHSISMWREKILVR